MALFDEIMEKIPDPAPPAAPPPAAPPAGTPPVAAPPPADSGEKRIHQYKDQFEKEYPEKK